MSQHTIDRAVAKTTGESLELIRSLGFGIADSVVACYDPEPPRRSQSGPLFHRRTGNAQREGKTRRRRRALLKQQFLSRSEPSAPRKDFVP